MELTEAENRYIMIRAKKLAVIEHMGGKCVECGHRGFHAFSIHHIRVPVTSCDNIYGKPITRLEIVKNENVNNFIRGNAHDCSWEAIKKELENAVLLCDNCHKKKHICHKNKSKEHLLIDICKVKKCHNCGYVPRNLMEYEFHHRDPSTKKFMISDVCIGKKEIRYSKPMMEVLDELLKCDPVCGNCHVVLGSNIGKFLRFQTLIEERKNKWIEDQATGKYIGRKNPHEGETEPRWSAAGKKSRKKFKGNKKLATDNRSSVDKHRQGYMEGIEEARYKLQSQLQVESGSHLFKDGNFPMQVDAKTP